MRALPSGTVTFLFTDVEGSTRLLQELGAERYSESLAEHRRTVRQACGREGGVEVDTQGDAFFMAFSEADGAARAADAIGTGLGSGRVRVRIGLHTGRPLLSEEGYVGEDVHLGARIAAAGHGGQVLMSRATRHAIGEVAVILDLGEHRLKDIPRPVPIYQLGEGSFPPLKTISNTNLPRPADSFIGRESEIEDVVARVQSGDRLVTLAGPGGTGKTRLAIEAAAALLPDFKAGVFWVDLVPVRDPDAVAAAVAATLTTEEDLAVHIGEREMLLVLDNVEHVINAAPWVARLVRTCPNLSVLVTSRERMRVHGESLVEVPPLASSDSGRLFAERSGLPVSTDVNEICARLEHLPLAIELAAARATSLTPRQILDRLGQRLDLLKGGRDADPRQRTLRATIDWSHDLLNHGEQRLLRRLSVFVAGTTLDGIEEVCGGDLDTVESLIDKSLVGSTDGRYTTLETVREYGAERLKHAGSSETDSVHERLLGHYLQVATRLFDDLEGAGLAGALLQLKAEWPNIRVALDWGIERGALDAARLAVKLRQYWIVNGPYLEGHDVFERCLEMELPNRLRAECQHNAGTFAGTLGYREEAKTHLTAAASTFAKMGEHLLEGGTLNDLGVIYYYEGDFERVEEIGLRAAELFNRAGYARGLALVTGNLGDVAYRTGRLDLAVERLNDALQRFRAVGDPNGISWVLAELVDAEIDRDDTSAAQTHAREAMRIARRGGDLQSCLEACMALGRVQWERGRRRSARFLVDLATRHADELGDREIAARVQARRAEYADAS